MALSVVYIDDELDLLDLFQDYFSSPEVNVLTFDQPEKAITHIQAHPPDVLFVDYRLPGTTGDEIAQRLDPKLCKVLVSGDIEVKTVARFDKVFAKPFNFADLQTFLQSKIKKSVAA